MLQIPTLAGISHVVNVYAENDYREKSVTHQDAI